MHTEYKISIQIWLTIYRKCHLAFNNFIETKVNFDWSDSEIGWKMANGQLLFCTLYAYACMCIGMYVHALFNYIDTVLFLL